MASAKDPQKPSRLGRGLSSLMARPVHIQPPPAPSAPPVASEPVPAPAAAPAAAAAPSATANATATAPPAAHTGASHAPAHATPSPGLTLDHPVVVEAPPAPRPARDRAAGSASPPSPTPAPVAVPAPGTAVDPEGLTSLAVTAIRPNPHQPRQSFDAQSLQRLADSILADGLMQPIIVRPITAAKASGSPEKAESPAGASQAPRFEIVAGERRWRAAQIAGLTHLPAIVRQLDERQVAEWALIENLQREDLNAMERAEAFQRLIDQFGLSHEQVAQRVGVERSSVSNTLRLLGLEHSVREMVRVGRLSGGQARALASLADPAQQRALGLKAAAHDWSVRQVEQAVRHATGQTAEARTELTQAAAMATQSPKAAHFNDLQEQIGRQLGTRVHIRPGRRKGSGTLTLEFHSVDQFEALLGRLGVEPSET